MSVCLSVNIFKLEYLRNQWANRNEVLSEPSLSGGIKIKSLDPLRAKKTFIRKKLGHTAVSAIKASSVTL